MNLKQFFYRYSSFTAAKISILLGRTLILILAYHWLEPNEFALIAGVISLVEIIRAFTDFGTENIIYSRLSSGANKLPFIVKKLIKFRAIISFTVSIIMIGVCYLLGFYVVAPLFLLLFTGAVQNSNIAFIQRERDFKKIFNLVGIITLVALLCLGMVLITSPSGGILVLMMLIPELFAGFVGAFFVRSYWADVVKHKVYFRAFYRRLLPFILPSLTVSVLVVLYTRLDIVLVRPLLGVTAQVDYSVAYRLVEPAFFVLSLTSLTLLAELGSFKSSLSSLYSDKLFKLLSVRVVVKLLIIGLLFAISLRWLSMNVLNVEKSSAWVCFILILSMPVRLLNSFLASLLQRDGRYKTLMYAAMITFFFTMLFGVLLGSKFGVLGVAVAVLLAESINYCYQNYNVRLMLSWKKNVINK